MIIYSIYKATNRTTGQSYIGFTNNFTQRKKSHLQESAKNEVKCSKKFYDALKEHGSSNFDWEIVYQSLNGEHCEVIMETFFIKYFGTVENGYNTMPGASLKRYNYVATFYNQLLPAGIQ